MNDTTQVLSLGTPSFRDSELALVEKQSGPVAAWHLALQRSPADAASAAQGHFAVGLQQSDGATFMAVDRFAAETLCYRHNDSANPGQPIVQFAKRADSLAAHANDIDPQALYDYLYFHAIPSPRTVYRGVSRLPAGHFAQGTRGGLHVAPYWQPTFTEVPARFKPAREIFLKLLEQSVASQLDGTRPACFLSGGTDSSTIAGMIARVTGGAPASYSIGFEAEGYDEMEYARLAARHFGCDHHEYYVTPADLVRGIPLMAAHLDQPFGNSSALPAYYCALKAREDGVTRLLAGDGGDELFGGNTRYAKQRVFGWYDAIPGAARRGLLQPLAASGVLDRVPLLAKGASYVRQASVPMPDRLQTYNLLERLGATDILTPGFISQVDMQGPASQERAVWSASAGASLVNRMLAYDWRYTLAENDLQKVRNSVELAGVSVGYPFLDQALVDFSQSLPTDYKLRRFRLRWFFKEALRGFLPDEILTKKKHGFGLPFGVWAVRDAGLQALARDSLRGLGERGIVRQEFTTALIDTLLPQHPGYYGEMVWILLMLEQWFRHHAPDYRMDR